MDLPEFHDDHDDTEIIYFILVRESENIKLDAIDTISKTYIMQIRSESRALWRTVAS